MIKNHKFKAIISSVIILLPILFGIAIWDKLPEQMVSHWGGDGVADGYANKAFMVFCLPLILLAVHCLCLLLTSLDKKSKTQNKKIVTLVYGIIPAVSLVVNGLIYAAALGSAENAVVLIPLLLGVLFMVLGNYMPKSTRNFTFGMKIKWTMSNDENWQKTHRLGGILSFVGGIVVLLTALLPFEIAMITMLTVVAVIVLVPTVYSYLLYRKHKAAGIEYDSVFDTKNNKIAKRIAGIAVPLILVGVAVLMFTGDVSVSYNADSFRVSATYSGSLTVPYESVDSLEYRETFSAGHRQMGFGSPRLSVGTFKNEEFGSYTLYAYTGDYGCVVVKQGENVLVIVGKSAEDTKAIYDVLAKKIRVQPSTPVIAPSNPGSVLSTTGTAPTTTGTVKVDYLELFQRAGTTDGAYTEAYAYELTLAFWHDDVEFVHYLSMELEQTQQEVIFLIVSEICYASAEGKINLIERLKELRIGAEDNINVTLDRFESNIRKWEELQKGTQ